MIKIFIPSGRQTISSGGFGGGFGNGRRGLGFGGGYATYGRNGYGDGTAYGFGHFVAAGLYAGYKGALGGGRGTPRPTIQEGDDLKAMIFSW